MSWHTIALVAISIFILWGAGLRFDCGSWSSKAPRPMRPLLRPITSATTTSPTKPRQTEQPTNAPKVPEPMLIESSVAMPFTEQPQDF